MKDRFNERSDGAFTLIVEADRPVGASPGFRREVAGAADRAAGVIEGAEPGPVQIASPRVVYVQINTPLENDDASDETTAMREAIPGIPGATTYLSGFPAINKDTQEIYNDDLARGESIAIPIALIVLAFMFGTLVAIGIPLAFAA